MKPLQWELNQELHEDRSKKLKIKNKVTLVQILRFNHLNTFKMSQKNIISIMHYIHNQSPNVQKQNKLSYYRSSAKKACFDFNCLSEII